MRDLRGGIEALSLTGRLDCVVSTHFLFLIFLFFLVKFLYAHLYMRGRMRPASLKQHDMVQFFMSNLDDD